MTNETKSKIETKNIQVKQNSSNLRAIVVVGIFVLIFISLIAFEVISRK